VNRPLLRQGIHGQTDSTDIKTLIVRLAGNGFSENDNESVSAPIQLNTQRLLTGRSSDVHSKGTGRIQSPKFRLRRMRATVTEGRQIWNSHGFAYKIVAATCCPGMRERYTYLTHTPSVCASDERIRNIQAQEKSGSPHDMEPAENSVMDIKFTPTEWTHGFIRNGSAFSSTVYVHGGSCAACQAEDVTNACQSTNTWGCQLDGALTEFIVGFSEKKRLYTAQPHDKELCIVSR